jgi:hypothetical protein
VNDPDFGGVAAVFVRGATNPILGGRDATGAMMLRVLRQLQDRHGPRTIGWQFKMAERTLDTGKVLQDFDPDLAKSEFLRI